jgi:amino acid adenylation domain-containing protein
MHDDNDDDTPQTPGAGRADVDMGDGLSHPEDMDLSSDTLFVASNPDEQEFPLSYMQEQLWFLAKLNPDLPIDNWPIFIDTPPLVDLDAFKSSLQAFVQRHEVLRTTFDLDQGRPVQVVHPFIDLDLPVVSLEGLSVLEQEHEMMRLAEAELRKPFDLERGPAFRCVLVRRSGGRTKLILVLHHAVVDGFSAYNILLPELMSLYDAYSSTETPSLPPPGPQIRHYALWQRRRVQDNVLDEHMGYWKRQLEGLPPALHLPTDRPYPLIPSARGAERSRLLPGDLIDVARRMSRAEGATLFTVLLAAFFALLYRYTGFEDIFVGTAVADRGSRVKRAIFGPLINMVVLRAKLGDKLSFRRLIGHVREVLREARDHSEIPFEVLVNELHPRRSPGQNPLFQVAFGYQASVYEGEWSVTYRGATTGTTSIDLLFDLQTVPEGVRIHAQYRTDLFDASTMDRMLEHYHVLLRVAVGDADVAISALPLLTDSERRLLAAWSEAPVPVTEVIPRRAHGPAGQDARATLHALFELQVERTPEATALIFGEEALSYRELNIRANQLAHRLRSMGIGPDSRVCICLMRTTLMLVAMLGVLKAGAAYVPMDPAFPRARVSFLLEDAAPAVVLTQRSLLALLPDLVPVLALDIESASILDEDEQNPAVEVRPENAAYVLYTSGSTGKPKGVVIEHRNTVEFLNAVAGSFTPEELAFVLGSTSISFDVSVFELFLPLCRGGAVVLARNALALPEISAQERVTLLSAVPSAMAALLDMGGMPASVQTVVLAGEPLNQELAERILELNHVRKLYNMYGPTECTTYSSGAAVWAGEAPTIGRPIANTRMYVLDRWENQAPIGVPGELYIAGAGVARGYLNRPELTAERFVPDPFGSGERLYRTGDLVRYTADGELAYMGRIDHQVKLRGFRVELGEIEATLVRHPLVREAAVLKVEDKPGDARLVAYVAPEPSASRASLAEALRSHLKGLLPSYMVPASFVFLDELPKTTSGKIDRRALPLEEREPEARSAYVEPKDEMELLIAGIWKRVFKVDEVSVLDNFFDLGGNSLLLVRVHDALQKAVGRPFPMLQLFTFPTIRSLAQALSSEPSGGVSLARAQDRARKQKLALEGQRLRVYVRGRKIS